MSEPMSQGEIEDVLSSIRRLVSEDLRPQPQQRVASVGSPASGDGRLILTPALRVVTGEDATGPEAQPSDEGRPDPADQTFEADQTFADEEITAWDDDGPGLTMAEAELSAPASGIEEVVASLAAQVHDGDWEPETGDEIADHPALHWADGAWADAASRAATSFDSMADVEEAELATVETSDAGLAAWGGADWATAEAALDHAEVPDDSAFSGAAAGQADAAVADAADRAAAEAIASIEADDVVPDLEQAAMAKLAAAAMEVEEEAGIGLFDATEGGFDEEALRDLVRDIIREELQGTLGERITRNVRKLVRVEVARALAAQQYE